MTSIDRIPSEAAAQSISPAPRSLYQRRGKRVFDLCFAVLIAPLVLPVVALLALAVKLDGGPAFFGHRRVGMGGKPFTCWKLRTMCVDADAVLERHLASDPEARAEWNANFKLVNDPRISKIGRILRKTSLDELPQLLNVIAGQMSFVGPRPIIEDEVPLYGVHIGAYTMGRPGVTGAWQVGGRNLTTYDERVALDAEYRKNESLALDIFIIAKTPLKVVTLTGH